MLSKRHLGPVSGIHGMTAGLGRILLLAAAGLYLAGLLLPFLNGSIRLLVVPVSRSLTLPEFAAHLAHDERYVTLGLVVAAAFVAPAALLLGIFPEVWPGYWQGRMTKPRPVAAALSLSLIHI